MPKAKTAARPASKATGPKPEVPAKVIRTRLPRNYAWTPTADGRPGYTIQ